MKKIDMFFNISPFVLWMIVFILEIFTVEVVTLMSFIQIVLFLTLPLILSIYNTVTSKDCGDIFIKIIKK